MTSARIQKWGNSQGLRVPKPLLKAGGFVVGEEVQVFAEAGRIIIQPLPPSAPAKWQPGRGGGDVTRMAEKFRKLLKGRKIDVKKALADHARARYAKWQR